MATSRFNELVAAYPEMASVDASIKKEIMKYFEAESEGIIKEFLTNAVVQPGTFANSAGNVAGAGKVT